MMVTGSILHANQRGATVQALLGAKTLTTPLPEITGRGFSFRCSHVPLDVATSTSKPHSPMLWTGEPGDIAGTLPLPSAWVALTSGAVQVALFAWLIQPVPCRLFVRAAPGTGYDEVLSGNFSDINIARRTAARALGGGLS